MSEFYCPECNASFDLIDGEPECPNCGSLQALPTSELEIE